MKFFHGSYFVGVKDKRYNNHPAEKLIIGLREEPKPLRAQYRVQNETETGKIKKSSKIKMK